MANNKEFYHCEECKEEFWVEREQVYKRGSLCPNKCSRNFQVYLGETEEEIERRRKEFLENKWDFEIEEQEEDESGGASRSSSKKDDFIME